MEETASELPLSFETLLYDRRRREEHAFSVHRRPQICFYCNEALLRKNVKYCEACKVAGKRVAYCGVHCQRMHWRAMHKTTCQVAVDRAVRVIVDTLEELD